MVSHVLIRPERLRVVVETASTTEVWHRFVCLKTMLGANKCLLEVGIVTDGALSGHAGEDLHVNKGKTS